MTGRNCVVYAIFTRIDRPSTHVFRGPVASFLRPKRTVMTDLIYLSLSVGFFLLGALYVRFCGSL